MATTGIKKIKVNKIDSNGDDLSIQLRNTISLRLLLTNNTTQTFNILSRNEYTNYFLFSVTPLNFTQTDNNIPKYIMPSNPEGVGLKYLSFLEVLPPEQGANGGYDLTIGVPSYFYLELLNGCVPTPCGTLSNNEGWQTGNMPNPYDSFSSGNNVNAGKYTFGHTPNVEHFSASILMKAIDNNITPSLAKDYQMEWRCTNPNSDSWPVLPPSVPGGYTTQHLPSWYSNIITVPGNTLQYNIEFNFEINNDIMYTTGWVKPTTFNINPINSEGNPSDYVSKIPNYGPPVLEGTTWELYLISRPSTSSYSALGPPSNISSFGEIPPSPFDEPDIYPAPPGVEPAFKLVFTDTYPEDITNGPLSLIMSSLPNATSSYAFSDFNPLINNIDGNVENKFYQVVDYNEGNLTASNFQAILDNNAERAQIPYSYYTAQYQINPRYVGCEMSAYEYNTYTSPFQVSSSNKVYTTYGTSLSVTASSFNTTWSGDFLTPSGSGIIDHYPVYFAHFKYSTQILQDLDVQQFTLDYLIPADFEVTDNITTLADIPGILKLSGDGTYQYITSNNFEKGRNCSIDFTMDDYNGLEWGTLESGSYVIKQGGSETQALFGTQTGSNLTSGSYNPLRMSFVQNGVHFTGSAILNPWITPLADIISFHGDQISPDYTLPSGKQAGLLASYLGQILTSNYVLKYPNYPGIVAAIPPLVFDPEPFYWIPSQSVGYEAANSMLTIEIGDNIRMVSSSAGAEIIDFTVTGIPAVSDVIFLTTVTPDPTDYTLIPSNFMATRRVDRDNKVELYIPHISGCLGIENNSSDGYLIPEDMSLQQKENVGKIVTILKGNNLFEQFDGYAY